MLTELACWFFSAIFSLARVNNPDILGDTAAYNLTGWREPGFLENATQSAAWGAWVEARLNGSLHGIRALLDIPANDLEITDTRADWRPERGFAAGMTLPGELWKAMSGFYESPEQAAATWIGTATCGAAPKPDPTPHPEGVFATVKNAGRYQPGEPAVVLDIEIAEYGQFKSTRTWAAYSMIFDGTLTDGKLRLSLDAAAGTWNATLALPSGSGNAALEAVDVIDTDEGEFQVYNFTEYLVPVLMATPDFVTAPDGVWIPLAEGEHRLEGVSADRWVSVASASNRSGAFSGEKLQGAFSVKPGLNVSGLVPVGLNTVADETRASWIMGMGAPKDAPAPLAGLKAIATATHETAQLGTQHTVAFLADQGGATAVIAHPGNFVEFDTKIEVSPSEELEGFFDVNFSLGSCLVADAREVFSGSAGVLGFTAYIRPFTGGNPRAFLVAETQLAEDRWIPVAWLETELKCSSALNAPIGAPLYLGEVNFSAPASATNGTAAAETTTWMLAAEKTGGDPAIRFGTFKFGSHRDGVLNGTVVGDDMSTPFSAPALLGRPAAENETIGWAASGNAVYEAYESTHGQKRRRIE